MKRCLLLLALLGVTVDYGWSQNAANSCYDVINGVGVYHPCYQLIRGLDGSKLSTATAALTPPAPGFLELYANVDDKWHQLTSAGVDTVVGAGAGGPPTGAAGGVLSGTYPNPGVAPPLTIDAVNSTLTVGAGADVVTIGSIVGASGYGAIYFKQIAPGINNYMAIGNENDTYLNAPTAAIHFKVANGPDVLAVSTASAIFSVPISAPGTQVTGTSSDPGCSVLGDVGKQWTNTASATDTAIKFCVVTASVIGWKTATLF